MVNAGILGGGRANSIGLNIIKGLKLRYRKEFTRHKACLQQGLPLYGYRAPWNFGQDAGDLHPRQLDFFAGTRKIPPHVTFVPTWAYNVDIKEDRPHFRGDPSFMVQIARTPSIRIIAILLNFPLAYLHIMKQKNVSYNEYGLLILDRDSGAGVYHNPSHIQRVCSAAFVRFVADSAAACLKQSFFISDAGKLSGKPHIFPYLRPTFAGTGRALALWIDAFQSRLLLKGDVIDALKTFLRIDMNKVLFFGTVSQKNIISNLPRLIEFWNMSGLLLVSLIDAMSSNSLLLRMTFQHLGYPLLPLLLHLLGGGELLHLQLRAALSASNNGNLMQ